MSDFLDFVQPYNIGLTEIRAIKGGKIIQEYWGEHENAAVAARSWSQEGWDAYYGVLPRASEDGTSAISVTPVLWADIDAKAFSLLDKSAALRVLLTYEVPPSIIVDSGHGYHAYWRLRHPVIWEDAKVAMVGLAKNLRGDHVYDASRILRMPDTTNWKDPDHPVPVRVIRFDTGRILEFRDFDRATRAGLHALLPHRVPRIEPTHHDPSQPLPQWLADLIQNGAPQGTRSEQSFKVVCELIRRGWSDQDIEVVFETQAIGDKYREKGNGGPAWLALTLRKAHAEVG